MAYETFRYVNHLNETLTDMDSKVWVNESDLHDYEWDTITQSDKISGFTRGITQKSLPLRIIADTEEEKWQILNQIYEIAEKDILSKSYGKFWVGDYYFKCYVLKTKKSDYRKRAFRYAANEITLVSDYPYWIKETVHVFLRRDDDSSGGDAPIVTTKRNFDYNYDFPYDYLSAEGVRKLYNPSFTASNFRMIIYGSAHNPQVKIGDYTYQVNVDLLSSEYITIDSVEKTIIKTKFDGTKENVFGDRNKESYIFQKIEAGNNSVIWDGSFRFDVVLFDERSEPLWI